MITAQELQTAHQTSSEKIGRELVGYMLAGGHEKYLKAMFQPAGQEEQPQGIPENPTPANFQPTIAGGDTLGPAPEQQPGGNYG